MFFLVHYYILSYIVCVLYCILYMDAWMLLLPLLRLLLSPLYTWTWTWTSNMNEQHMRLLSRLLITFFLSTLLNSTQLNQLLNIEFLNQSKIAPCMICDILYSILLFLHLFFIFFLLWNSVLSESEIDMMAKCKMLYTKFKCIRCLVFGICALYNIIKELCNVLQIFKVDIGKICQ